MKRVPPVLRKKKYEYSLHCYELVLEADPNSLRMHKKGRSAQEDWTVRGGNSYLMFKKLVLSARANKKLLIIIL